MPFVFKRLVLSISIAAALAGYNLAADKEARFTAEPAARYPHQTVAKVTIGVQAFVSEQATRPAFGKKSPYKEGILPVLVVIQNDSAKAIRVEDMKVQYQGPDRSRVAATPAADVKYLGGARKPNVAIGPTGPKISRRKGPLDTWEIEGRAFSAKMIPPGESASGFFYFQTGYQKGASLYLTGLTEADTGNELFYFEVPLADK